jgi:hypothetical protein
LLPKRISQRFVLRAVVLGSALVLNGCTGCGALSPFAYPHAWDFTRSKPKDTELVGTYWVLKTSGSPPSFRLTSDVRITLNADHTAAVYGIPEYDPSGERIECIVSTSGTWEVGAGSDLTLEFWPKDADRRQHGTSQCGRSNTPLWLLGQRKPYRLYLCIGDPDSDVGIEFSRN